jgi:ParB family chromosome partitioning protein
MAKEIVALHDRGYSIGDIASKVDLDHSYVRGIIRLLKQGEERLLRAVEERQIPLSMAIEIAESDDKEVQRLMSEAYEKNELRGKALLVARRLLEKRRSKGKGMYERKRAASGSDLTLKSDALVKVYKREAARLQLMVKRADATETRLQFIVSAFKKLMTDEAFCALIRAESLGRMPKYLLDQMGGKEGLNGN